MSPEDSNKEEPIQELSPELASARSIKAKRATAPEAPAVEEAHDTSDEISDSVEGSPKDERYDWRRTAGKDTGNSEDYSITNPSPRMIGWCIALLGFLSVIFTYGGLGWSWDEAYYLPPAQLALDWATLGGAPRDPESLHQYWREINELPPVCKWIWAGSLLTFEPIIGTVAAMRLPAALLFALTLLILFHWLAPELGRGGAALAALSLAAMPRVFGHAHFAATETATMFVMLAATVVFYRATLPIERIKALGLQRWPYIILSGICFGLAIATKINGAFLFPAMLLWAAIYQKNQAIRPLAAMVFLGPPIFIMLWPWIWHDTMRRILEYFIFHATHQDTAIWYMNQKWGYGDINAPTHYPIVMIAITTPLVLLAGLGIGFIRFLIKPGRPLAGLMIIQALIPILIIAAPGQPKYDGVRLFLPAFPFLAALIAYGYEGVIARISAFTKSRLSNWRRPLLYTTAAAIIISGVVAKVSIQPFYLSYFNVLVGGLPGAWERGYEVTYWGETLNDDVLDYLNDPENIPEGSSIKTRAFFARALRHRQEWGELRDDLYIDELAPGSEAFDFHLIQARRGFWTHSPDWMLYQRILRAEKIFEHQGVPMFILYGSLEDTFN